MPPELMRPRPLGKPDPMTDALARWVSEGGAYRGLGS
jgi:hypothetical protein